MIALIVKGTYIILKIGKLIQMNCNRKKCLRVKYECMMEIDMNRLRQGETESFRYKEKDTLSYIYMYIRSAHKILD